MELIKKDSVNRRIIKVFWNVHVSSITSNGYDS